MTNAQNNDLILQYELRRLNGALQEAFALERQEFQQWATQAEQTIVQLGQDKAKLYNMIDEERGRAAVAGRAADYWKAVAEGAGADVEEAAAALAADEQRIAGAFDAAIAPATAPKPVPFEVIAPDTADGAKCVNCGAGAYSAAMPMDNDGNCLNCGESFTVKS